MIEYLHKGEDTMKGFKLVLVALGMLVACNNNTTTSKYTNVNIYENCSWNVNEQGNLDISFYETHYQGGELIIDKEYHWELNSENCMVVYQKKNIATLDNKLYEQVKIPTNSYTLVVYERW